MYLSIHIKRDYFNFLLFLISYHFYYYCRVLSRGNERLNGLNEEGDDSEESREMIRQTIQEQVGRRERRQEKEERGKKK